MALLGCCTAAVIGNQCYCLDGSRCMVGLMALLVRLAHQLPVWHMYICVCVEMCVCVSVNDDLSGNVYTDGRKVFTSDTFIIRMCVLVSAQ